MTGNGNQRLAGRFALITGGSRGIGRSVAMCFAREGATVAINHLESPQEAEETRFLCGAASPTEREHLVIDADVSKSRSVEAMIAEAVQAWGRIDIVVNNAGVQAETPGDAIETDALERVLAVNLLGAAHVARAAIRSFLSRPGGGVVINTSSVHEIIPKPGFLAYSMSKGGIGNLTRTLALEFADRGIRVNGVGPGATLTAMNDAWRHDPDARAGIERHIPMGYAAAPDEIAPVYAFLASDEARYITGQTLFVDGGLTLYGDFKQNWAS
jgi:glucose 1-dehydrogenase